MSHLKERKEKICLNCNAELYGHYCHVCGQENTEPKESFWHLATHFFNDLTHFDGKFFKTVKYLLFRPGFLSAEYARGKRASYLNPIRMYIFTSAIFFLVFSWYSHVKVNDANSISIGSGKHLQGYKEAFYKSEIPAERDSIKRIVNEEKKRERDSLAAKGIIKQINNEIDLNEIDLYSSVWEYDSLQKLLPPNDRDNWITRTFERKAIENNLKYKGDNNEIQRHTIEGFLHNIPKGLIVGLPLLALLLGLLYVRKKEFNYVNHIIFIIDLTIATFIIMMIRYLISWIANKIHLQGLSIWTGIILALCIFFYLYKAMRNFYRQSRGKTIFKYGLFLFGSFILFAFMATILILISAWLA